MSGLGCLKAKHLTLLKQIARHLLNNLECAWQFSEKKANRDAGVHRHGSMDTMLLYFGIAIFESSTCTPQVAALSRRESELNGVLRGSACALQVRQLFLDMNLKMEAEVSRDSSAA